MAATVASICNRALVRIGGRTFVSDIDTEDSTEAGVLSQIYEPARDELLELFHWPFAKMEAELAVVEDIERSGWTYAYGLPTTCIDPRCIYAGERLPSPSNKIPFEVVAAEDLNSRYLMTDLEDAVLIYTARISNPAMFSPLFADALSWKLAIDLSMALSVKADFRAQAADGFRQALAIAQSSALNAQHETERDSDLITSRS